MTRLFIRFYLGVLAVLAVAWYVHDAVSEMQYAREVPGVAENAHRGGAMLLARKLNSLQGKDRDRILQQLRESFDFPVRIVSLKTLPEETRARISGGDQVVHYRGQIGALLDSGTELVELGPFPQFTQYEYQLGGGVRLAAGIVEATSREDRQTAIRDLAEQFGYPIRLMQIDDLPRWEQYRLASGDDIVLYLRDGLGFIVSPVDQSQILRFGPLPNFDGTRRRALATATAVVLLIAALAIAVLLRPVMRQLRCVEDAARAVSRGDLTARVDERQVRSARPLAKAFNSMASRTETVLRTQHELLQAVSHELRTPLSRIRFAIELIETAQDEGERRERLRALDDAAQELNELVEELLNYVRLENTEVKRPRESVALQNVITTQIEKYASLNPALEFSVTGFEPGNPETVIHADPVDLCRAVSNLLGNAARFAESQVTVSVAVNDSQVTIDVDDDGRGIPDSERDRVLEPFVRLEDGDSSGVGLGLSIVRRIVTGHGGEISVQATPGGGTRMRTTWPGCC